VAERIKERYKEDKMNTPQEIFEYNKNVHSFLGYKSSSSDRDFYFVVHPETNSLRELNFNRGYVQDWNFIMEVKTKICQLNIVDEFNVQYDSVAKGYHCSILPAYKNSFEPIYTKTIPTEKEAVVHIINQFLIWYSKNKK